MDWTNLSAFPSSPICPDHLEIQNGALFIADVHYGHYRRDFESLLSALENGTINPPQIFLMGDIFDLLVGEIKSSTDDNGSIITRLNQLSQKIEMVYLEGNHDFNLASLFPHMTVFSRSEQPVAATIDKRSCLFSHGDKSSERLHESYMSAIRNRRVLQCLNTLEQKLFQAGIYKKLVRWLEHKEICSKLKSFEKIVKKRLEVFSSLASFPEVSYIVEGHYHQGEVLEIGHKVYVGLPAYACVQSFFVVEFSNSGINFTNTDLRSLGVCGKQERRHEHRLQ